jgi:hypothetical protein
MGHPYTSSTMGQEFTVAMYDIQYLSDRFNSLLTIY